MEAPAVPTEENPVKLASPTETLRIDEEKPTTHPIASAPPQAHHKISVLDSGEPVGLYRRRWFQVWVPRDPPLPPPKSLDDAAITPLATANIISLLTYHWITPIITLGYQRPLQAPDLWKMDPSREAGTLSSEFDRSWDRRVEEAKVWNDRLAKGEINPSLVKRTSWRLKSVFGKRSFAEQEETWRKVEGQKHASLVWALNDVLGAPFWLGGLFKVFGDTCQLMGPLVSKSLITFGQERMYRKATGQPDPGVGRGIAMAIGLALLTISASIGTHQFFWRSMNAGVLARCALISSLYKRGLKLTPKARSKHTNASLVNHMSTDISRIDYAAAWFHAVWTAPIQMMVCLALLIVQLGPSALAGFAVFVCLLPVQRRIMELQIAKRKKSMKWTGERAGLLQELLGAMRIIKYFCYEVPFLQRIDHIRREELKGIASILLIKSANLSIALSVPVFASVLAFVVYSLAGHSLDPAVIFTSLSFFQLLRQPLIFLPRALSSYADAKNAVGRLTPVWEAETLGATTQIDPESKWAVQVQDADFQWEETAPPSSTTPQKGHGQGGKGRKTREKATPSTGAQTPAHRQEPFALRNVSLRIPRGQLYAIAGPVGSGKSSLLMALIGEMKQLRGPKPVFGGSIAYCSQMAWIQNASLRENVLFGAEFEEERYWNAVQDASLLSDLEMLPDGDLTEIGEKGINLSGGQKQRVNIARALYHDSDIVILDDPLSAVDAHVGEALFNNAILGALKNKGKTVILVTHALHFLHHVDYIYNIVEGKIVEQGTYDQLVQNGQAFSQLLQEFSGKQTGTKDDETVEEELEEITKKNEITLSEARRKIDLKTLGKAVGTGKIEGRLMKTEKRSTGSIEKKVYSTYLKAGKGWWTVPLVVLSAILMQGASVISTYWLIWWQLDTFHRSTKFYMILYAVLGAAQTVLLFAFGAAMSLLSLNACRNLHKQATDKIFHAPMSFFDTTPLGRILGVFGKDIDVVDNPLSDSLLLFTITLVSALGSVIIITYVLHYFIIAVCVAVIGYWYFSAYYRESARELKRLDGNLRSLLYSHFTESLTGLSTIRAYGAEGRFLRDNEYFTDLEDRALFLTCTNQRWLAIRLDFMGALLIFIVALLSALGVGGANPAQIGLVLVYSISLTQILGMVTRQSAEVENNMNAVERIVHYTRDDLIDQEAPHIIEDRRPPPEWPRGGAVQFKDVVMRYRPGLPSVLKGVTMDINSGEKIGVVGRTGAGKSSLMIALYRIVELTEGSIWLDGIDISSIGLNDLRSKAGGRISIIPQDPLLFSGTIRSNLDPFSLYDDAKLHDALRRAHLIGPSNSTTDSSSEKVEAAAPPTRFTLDMPVEPEGANLSVGERSLLSLARALVRDEIKVVIMDEATASVDVETDAAIQDTISKEFGGKTLLCIAHRLRTIIRYDRVLVLDNGTIAEFDTPHNLFKVKNGIFRGLCEQSKIQEEDLMP